LCIVPI